MKSISNSIIFLFFAAVVFVTVVKAQTIDEKSLSFLAGNKITGAWRVNYAESDDPILKMRRFLQNKLASSAGEKNGDAKDDARTSVSLVPPETLVLAGDDDQSITINENFGEILFTRTFSTDGKMRGGELPDGTIFSAAATQNDNSLKVEIVSPRGNKMSETYALFGDGKKLIVTVRFETAQTKELLTLRRVYDRAIPDVSADGAEQIQ